MLLGSSVFLSGWNSARLRNGPSIQVKAPDGLAHFPQIPTPQLVMYSIDPKI